MAGRWTRRELLRTAGASSLLLLLAGCGGKASPTPTGPTGLDIGASPAHSGGGSAPPSPPASPAPVASTGKGLREFQSRPDIAPPSVTVATAAHATDAGNLFVTAGGPLILDDAGDVVWYRQTPGKSATNFRVQTYQGQPVLTWWEGQAPHGYGIGDYVIADASYQEIRRFAATDGPGDLHEFLITPEDTALTTAYRAIPWDLSPVRGPKAGTLLDCVVQEVDLETGQLRFDWRATSQVPLAATYADPPADAETPFDYFHVNSVERDTDGNYLVSARNTWAVYKIDASSGKVIWTLGGKLTNFQMAPGSDFAWQHDARRQADGSLTLFDDEASPAEGDHSRGLILRVDEEAMTATLVREFVHPDKLLAGSQGNLQVLPNGNVFIGWGQEPWFSEFAANGDILFDAHFDTTDQSYRAFRQPWSAQAADAPAIAVRPGNVGRIAVFASWNGATEVARWRVFAGETEDDLKQISEAARSGFETRIDVVTSKPVIAVQAIDRAGKAMAASRPSSVKI